MANEDSDLDAPVWEAKNIALIIGRTERQTYHLIRSGALPVKQVGNRYVSTRRKLLDAVVGDAA